MTRSPEQIPSRNTTSIRLTFQAGQQYNHALGALLAKNLVVANREPGFGIGTFASLIGATGPGVIWIPAHRINDARRVLQAVGIVYPEESLPIVDQSEKVCPSCDGIIDCDSAPPCTHCGYNFQWICIEEPETDLTGVHCYSCGYDLTGLNTRRCPECFTPAPVDLDALVNSNSHEEDQDGENNSKIEMRKRHPVIQFIRFSLLLFTCIFIIVGILINYISYGIYSDALVKLSVIFLILTGFYWIFTSFWIQYINSGTQQ